MNFKPQDLQCPIAKKNDLQMSEIQYRIRIYVNVSGLVYRSESWYLFISSRKKKETRVRIFLLFNLFYRSLV